VVGCGRVPVVKEEAVDAEEFDAELTRVVLVADSVAACAAATPDMTISDD
jgi:hypothetical protein